MRMFPGSPNQGTTTGHCGLPPLDCKLQAIPPNYEIRGPMFTLAEGRVV